MKREINFLCHTTSAAVTKIRLGVRQFDWLIEWEAAHDWLNAWTESTIYNLNIIKLKISNYKIALKKLPLQSIWLFSVFCFPSIFVFLCSLFPSLTPPPQPNASFPYRPLHLSLFFIGGFTDSANAYSCRRPPNSVAFLNSSCSTDDLRKKSISSVTGINERSVSSSTEYHANSTSTSHNLLLKSF